MTNPPPGWYLNGQGPGIEGYWNGNAWTGQIRAAGTAPTVIVQNAAGPRYVGGLSAFWGFVNLVLTCCTLGLWWPIWRAIERGKRHKIGY